MSDDGGGSAGHGGNEAYRRWTALAEAALGRPVAALTTTTPGGLAVRPLYPRHRGGGLQPWRAGDGWAVAPRVDHPDPDMANAFALAELEGGADALTLVVDDSPFARGHGLPAERASLAAALEGVELDLIALRLDAGGPAALAALAALAEVAVERRLSAAGLRIDGGFDPIGWAACAGVAPDLSTLQAALAAARRGGFAGCPLLADGRPYAESGAGEAEELAAVLATAVAYLRRLVADGTALDAARDAIAVLLPADADILGGIAKMRAMRRLWARVEELCRLDAAPLRLHAETAWRCMTRRDPRTNALRGTLGAMAAGLGGADSVTVLPMTLVAELPDAAARRLARNSNRILLDEANLARVDDPAAGSGALEGLTDALCEEAWELFQQIEAEGGLSAAEGVLHRRIAASAARRAAGVADRGDGIVGTSLYPLPASGVVAPPDRGATHSPSALPRRRDAEPFEALRERGEAAGRPLVFLAALGPPAGYGPRAAAAANLFAAAGLEATAPTAAAPTEVGPRFRASGAALACLCGSDDAYRGGAEAAIEALRDAGARMVMMAGQDEAWRTTGIDALIHDRCPALQLLGAALEVATAP